MKRDKIPDNLSLDNEFDSSWTLENALYILQHPTVDSKVWADAVEWLLLNGPPEMKKLLLDASDHATQSQFPEMSAKKYSPEGNPCYDIDDLAKALGVETEEVKRILVEKEQYHSMRHGFEDDDTTIIQ